MTHYPKFILNKGRILVLWGMDGPTPTHFNSRATLTGDDPDQHLQSPAVASLEHLFQLYAVQWRDQAASIEHLQLVALVKTVLCSARSWRVLGALGLTWILHSA